MKAVSFDEGEALAREFKIPFFETSAMNDINVEDAFMRLTKDVLKRMESGGDLNDGSGKKLPPVKVGKNVVSARSLQNAPPPKKSWC